MAVTSVFTRTGNTDTSATSQEFVTAGLTGTYVTGGFTWNPFAISGGQGTSPLPGSKVLAVQFLSPLGYLYSTVVAGLVATTKIFSAPGTELAAGALPDASVPVIITKSKI